MNDDYEMRRFPVTVRGLRRLDAILDAAAYEFAEVGYGAATTNAIAKRAHSSIGSLYQFFPNKQAILSALSERYLNQLGALNDSLFTVQRIRTLSLPSLMEQVVDTFADYCLREPGFEYIFYGSEARDYLRSVSQRIHSEIVSQVEHVLERHVSHLVEEERNIVANLTVAAMQATMPFVIVAHAARQIAIIAHLKLMITTYLQTVAQSAA